MAMTDGLELLGARTRTRAAWAMLVVTFAVALGAGTSWWLKARDNALIQTRQASTQRPLDAPLPPALRFAQAQELAASGKSEAALTRYRGLHGDLLFGSAARYNSANLLMRQAIALDAASPGAGQAIALIELAKQSYRDVLRVQPRHWGARYNMERAQRLQPDPDESDPAIAEPRNDAERATARSRGVEGGLP